MGGRAARYTGFTDIRILLLLITAFGGCFGDDVANPAFFPPVIGDFVPQNCWNFSLGDWKQHEFYSPSYPSLYTNNTECIQLLVAPRGYHIRLDFRDEFHIEASEKCKYDFLELRDGPFGYSPLLGRHCGKRHPPMAESSSRFLWIMFKSDESIEYAGFRAVYEFFKPGEEDINRTKNYTLCRIDVDISKNDGFMSAEDIPQSYLQRVNATNMPVDCTWVIYTPPKHRIYVRWREYEMTTPESCRDSFLEAYDRTTAISNRRKQFCGGMAKDLKSASNHFYLRLHSADVSLIPKFSALFTIFIHGTCTSSTFDCGDNTCVNKSLVCNDQVNCNFSWDEMFCKKSTPTTMTEQTPVVVQYSTIILGIVGGIIITVICLSVCITCHQRRREETRRKNALKQEERNAIEMTTLLTRTPQGSPQRSQHARAAAAAAAAAATANHVTNNNQVMPNHAGQRSNGIRQASSQGQGQGSVSVQMGNATSGGGGSTMPKMVVATTVAPHTYASVGSVERRGRMRRDHSISSADYDLGSGATGGVVEHYPMPPEEGAFKRYLDVSSYSDEDLGRRQSASRGSRREIPAAVMLERPITTPRRSRPLTASLSEDLELPAPTINPGTSAGSMYRPHTLPRERSPSPRPDVVQEERYPELSEHGIIDDHYPIPPEMDARYDPRGPAADAQSLPERHHVRRYSLETLISEKSDVWKPRTGTASACGGDADAHADRVLTSRGASIDSADDLDRTYWSSEQQQPPSRSYHEQPKVTVSPVRRKSPKSPSRSDSYKRRKSAGTTNSPDIFYSRPNRSVRQHHPV